MDSLPKEFECGIYFGWASVEDGPLHKMVMSVGWNPFYNNTKKTMVRYSRKLLYHRMKCLVIMVLASPPCPPNDRDDVNTLKMLTLEKYSLSNFI